MTLSELTAIALTGGDEILKIYGTSFDTATKADSSPVTQADIRCEAVMKPLLAGLAPQVVIVAEEAVSGGEIPADARQLFLVDPLDGTKEFISRNGDFTVNIALVEDGVPVAGVVYAPAIGTLWAGSTEEGAFRAEVKDGVLGERRAIVARSAPDSLVAVGSRSHGSAETEAWLKRYEVERFVSRGSSLKFCLVAEGEADVYPRLGRTMEWDTAAGDAVLRAAGGIVTTLDGQPLRYGKRRQASDVDFANPHFVAFADPRLAMKLAQDAG
ncbi:3'(2'),5'-bisphosphate nucleotidase CysQ [Aurantimonas sp. 22II-16-19i]|uniref:3'(2'),5'-bisphosphate nucleotidase CysQ n=1 Tax=Aurantimonas sp. 22II-16-19i TaxID=1317114 RepID=UPI0009F7D1C5|nr:3'(2'),5'-bisphosphate nucleotidase CysQ [Aurantimonas sp. 22II-16-19i]ORE97364.1 3'(2'),5'-bisphosphate nucleotidase [Aurantimonas sp. 22II-16-19i]